MSAPRRVACLWVPGLAAAAAERCEPALAEHPLAVVRGTPPATRVVEGNAVAREHGVAPGMTEAQARARCPGLVTRTASGERLAAARHALLEAALAVSPCLEDAAPGLVFVDIGGLGRLIGDDTAIGERLVRQARQVGLTARVAIAGSRTTARIMVRAGGRSPVVVVPPGREAVALAPVPVARLELSADVATALGQWGVRTLGELAALPRADLAERLGPAGLRAQDQARGRDGAPFQAWTPPPFWEEAQGLDWEIAELPALVPVLRELLGRLAARLEVAHQMADQLDVQLALVTGARHERTIGLAYPSRDVATVLGLVRLDLEAHPPPAPVTGVALSVRPVRERAEQAGLWQPPGPVPRALTALLGRLVELVGDARVGAPILDDTHRPDPFTLRPFAVPAEAAPGTDALPGLPPDSAPALVLRRLRPPRPVTVTTEGDRPAQVARDGRAVRVVSGAGPWRLSGEWWDRSGWARDEWDLLLADGTLCRLALDRVAGQWLLDGVYD